MMRPFLPFFILAMAVGCGDDGGAAGPDAGGDPDAATGGDGGPVGPYSDPADFDRTDCSADPALDSIEVDGIWHLDLDFADFGSYPATLRIDGTPGAYSALLFGNQADHVIVDAEDLFIRRAWTTSQGGERVQAMTACAVGDDGGLRGAYASCTNGECYLGTFAGYRVDPLPEPVGAGMTLLAHYQGPAADPWPTDEMTANVRVSDGLAYVVRFGDGLRIVDLSDLEAVHDRGHAPVMYEDYEIYNDVKLVEGPNAARYAIVGSNLRGAVVIDVSDPDNPAEVAQFPPPPAGEQTVNVHTLFIDGSRAYLANTTIGGLDIFDVSDPASPQRLGQWVHPMIDIQGGLVHDLFVRDGRAFLNYWNLGMVILDTQADPADPTVVGIFDSYARRTSHSSWVVDIGARTVAVHGDEDFGAHVRIIDVTDPESVDFLDTLAEYQTRPQVSVHNILAHGNLAFITYYQDGLRVLDLADPADPVEIAHYHTWPGAEPGYGEGFYEGAIGVDYDATSGHIYVADTHSGLWVMTLDP